MGVNERLPIREITRRSGAGSSLIRSKKETKKARNESPLSHSGNSWIERGALITVNKATSACFSEEGQVANLSSQFWLAPECRARRTPSKQNRSNCKSAVSFKWKVLKLPIIRSTKSPISFALANVQQIITIFQLSPNSIFLLVIRIKTYIFLQAFERNNVEIT